MASVGDILRQEREKKELTLDNVSRATKIKKDLIEALENGDFQKVPSPTYVRGFLKIYASYLGLDSEEIVQEYLKDHVGDSEQVFVLDVEGNLKTRIDPRIIKYAVIGGVAVIVLVLIFVAVRSFRRSRKASSPAPRRMEILEPSTATIDETDLIEPVVPEAPREMELRLKATNDVWVKVVADGVTVFQNVIKKGSDEFWKGKSGFKMKLGRPDAVILTLDGKPITISGKMSKPRTVEIDGEGNVEVSD